MCKRSWHLPGNPKLVWHPACILKEWGCMDLSKDTLHLKYPLVLFGYEGSALTLPLFLLSPRIIMLCHWSSTMTEDYSLIVSHGTKWPLCIDVPLNTHSFIHWHKDGPALKAVWSKAPPNPGLGMWESCQWLRAMRLFFAGYSGFLFCLQQTSHKLATIGINMTKNKIPT